jgi:predicted TIM-barrel fold metal-dependent hydrolase
LQKFPCSWCNGIPALNRSFRLDQYLAAAQGTGIEKTVFVECDVDEPHSFAEAQFIQNLADKNPLISGIIAAARPERADFPAQLDALLGLPKLRGIRRVLHVVPDEISQSARFAENIRRLAAHGLIFDLCVLARQLPLAMALVKKCPEVHFVLDHSGVPDVKGKTYNPWRAQIAELATQPNVACKISGLVAYAGENWQLDDLRPWVEHAVASFGWERVLWGGDWPVCTLTATLPQWVEASDKLFATATTTQREQVFYKNAERIYRI